MKTDIVTHDKRFLPAVPIVIGALIGLTMPVFLKMVVDLGQNIPQANLEGDYVFAVIWAAVLGATIFIWPVSFTDKRGLLWIWLAKSFVVLMFMLFYEGNYTALDAYSSFEISTQSNFPFEELGLGAGSQNINFLAWLHSQVLPNSYHALKVSFSMIGLVAVYLFYRAAVIFLQREDRRILYLLALFPSILFWSSILGKDPIVLLGIALYVYGVVAWYQFKKVRYLWVLLLGVLVAGLIRIWLGPILLAPLAILVLQGKRHIVPKVAFMVFTTMAFILLLNQFMDQFSLESLQDALATADVLSRSWAGEGGSGQEISADLSSIGQAVGFVPLGIFTALFRPLPGEVLNIFGLLAGIENLFLLVLFGLAIKRMDWKKLKHPLVVWAIALVLIWATVYGFLSYQNLGTAVRFKLQILPVLLGLLLYLGRRKPMHV